MRFLFLNQYGPPDPVPTARLLSELAEGLRAEGHVVEIVSQRSSYHERPMRGGRLKRELIASWAILRAGWKVAGGKPDVIVTLTSPPGLLVIGALLAWRHRARLTHWAMDLYPELALALGELRPGSLVARVVAAAIRWAYQRASVVVALDEDMGAHLQAFCRNEVRTLQPWLAPIVEHQLEEIAFNRKEPSTSWTWLYSGNLGRAHEWRTLLDAQARLEARGLPVHLVFQGDGAARALAMAYAEQLGLRFCEWKDYVTEAELLPTLLDAHLLVATQRPETRGLLWPSKLALLERLPRPILFVGPSEGAIAELLRQRSNAGVFAPDQAQEVADWIEALYRQSADALFAQPEHTGLKQKDACAILVRWLTEYVD